VAAAAADDTATLPPNQVEPVVQIVDWPTPPGYEILDELGRGGMGVVYKARDINLDRVVALKTVLAGGHASGAELVRLRTEAVAIARVQHPNIVQIYKVGEHDGLPFLALEFCPGGSLDKKLAGNPMAARQATQLVEVLAQAVRAAHEQRVLHRDLKPANVLFAANGTPKITDFGLAKKLDEQGQTATGAILGTPSYMAPEQAGGKKVGPAADVYALGAVLYECLTGRPPFKGPTPLDTVFQVLSEEPVPPGQLVPTVPRDVETICLKCLQKEAVRRYESARSLAEDLQRFTAGKPVLARPIGRIGRFRRWCRRNPAVAALAALAIVLLITGTIVSWFLAIQALHSAAEADFFAGQASRRATEAEQGRDEALQNLYVSQMSLAHQAWKDGRVGRMLELLQRQHPERTGGRDFRGFEWHYLNNLPRAGHQVWAQHELPVLSVACSRDGRFVASTSGPELSLWDAASGRELRKFPTPVPLFAVALSPSGERLAAWNFRDGVMFVWDTATGKEVFRLPGQRHARFSPDGKYLATSEMTRDGQPKRRFQVHIWNAADGSKVAFRLPELESFGLSLAFSPDGRRLAIGFALLDGVQVFELATGRRAVELTHPGKVRYLDWSQDGTLVTSAGDDIRFWDVATAKEKFRLRRGQSGDVTGLALSPDGRKLASTGTDSILRVWDCATGELVRAFRGHPPGLADVVFSAHGGQLFSAGGDKLLRRWDIDKDQDALTVGGLEDCLAQSFSPDGSSLAIAYKETYLRSAASGELMRRFPAMRDPWRSISATAFSPHGDELAAGGAGGLSIWNVATGQEVCATGKFGNKFILDIAFSPNGKQLVAIMSSSDRRVVLYDLPNTLDVVKLEGVPENPWRPCSVAYSPDGLYIAAANANGTIVLWDAATRQLVRTWPKSASQGAVRFAPDGQALFAANMTTVTAWRVRTGETLFSYALDGSLGDTLAEDGPRRAAFSQDCKRLATVGADGRVKVWDLTCGQQVLSLEPPGTKVVSLAFSPNVTRLAALGRDGTQGILRIWDATPRQPPP
jgi:WD40 repeat protein